MPIYKASRRQASRHLDGLMKVVTNSRVFLLLPVRFDWSELEKKKKKKEKEKEKED